jgi:FMN phosphatase YigB (HAD superfamily)
MKQRIAFDLDGTLINLFPAIEWALMELFGATVVPTNTWQIETDPPMPKKKIWEAFELAYGKQDFIQPYAGSGVLLERLWNLTLEPIKIVTARPTWAVRETYKTVERFCKVPFEIAFTGGKGTKLHHLYGRDIFVDDYPKYAIEAAMNGMTVYLLDRPYAQIDDGFSDKIIKISDISELIPLAHNFVRGV